MTKRIFRAMTLLVLITLLLVSSAMCAIFYSQFAETVHSELRERAELFQHTDSQAAMCELVMFKPTDMRITLIDPAGTVIYDNTVDARELGNHSGRMEIQKAIVSGTGEIKRVSDTMRQETYYYAVRLTDGSILRISKTTNSVFGMFDAALPAVVGVVVTVFFISYLLARNLTKRIVEPINRVNINDTLVAPYEELIPFISTIERQRAAIARQLSDLQEHTDTISAIIDNMNEGIILVDKKGLIASINKSASALLELAGPINDKNILEVTRNLEIIERFRGALSGIRSELVAEYDGKTYRIFFSPVAGSGAIILFLDITEKAMGEKMRREFSANVSHELKTPLTSIYGHAEMLAENMVKEADKQEFYTKIKDEAGRLISLIENIILISKLDEGRSYQHFGDVDIASVARESLKDLSLKAQERGVATHVSGDSVHMRADSSMLYEMFYNLIDNAIKYNKPGGTVNIDIVQSAERIMITVADTGIGIPKESQTRVFERFYMADKSRSKKSGGTGLGLAIVKHIVTLHNGVITLKSCENEGTVITVAFEAKNKP